MVAQVARRLTVRGHVQGVFFRATTRRVAREHDVRGWVANRGDGAVEVWLEGPPVAVAAVEAWIEAGGPSAAEVSDVEVRPVEPAGHQRFEVRPDLP